MDGSTPPRTPRIGPGARRAGKPAAGTARSPANPAGLRSSEIRALPSQPRCTVVSASGRDAPGRLHVLSGAGDLLEAGAVAADDEDVHAAAARAGEGEHLAVQRPR